MLFYRGKCVVSYKVNYLIISNVSTIKLVKWRIIRNLIGCIIPNIKGQSLGSNACFTAFYLDFLASTSVVVGVPEGSKSKALYTW